MNERDTPDLRHLGVEPEDLDGHTIDELTDYLDAGRRPANHSIDRSPGCQIALEALERLHALAPRLLAADAAAEPPPEESWVQNILAGITLDARAGRRIPISTTTASTTVPDADLGVTEGAVRGVMRAAENAVPGVLVGRCRLDGEVTQPGEPVRVRVDVSTPYGEPIPELVDRLRAEIGARLLSHTTLNVTGIDITVQDIRQLAKPAEEER